jgi:hypothetical protein
VNFLENILFGIVIIAIVAYGFICVVKMSGVLDNLVTR